MNTNQYYQEEIKPKIQLNIRHFLPPANPITTKIIQQESSRNHKLVPMSIPLNKIEYISSKRKSKSDYVDENQQITLLNYYSNDSLIYKKYENAIFNKRINQSYMASIFIDNFLKFPTAITEQKKNCLCQFISDYQSANLFATYKVGDKQYDLILQNDINSCGYAQWFNFKVLFKGKSKQATPVRFNIINLYKSHSLYKVGMKPLARSNRHKKQFDYQLQKDKEKGWRRNTYKVQYFQNQISLEINPKKNYYTLSFCYDFQFQGQEVQFCHFYPYNLQDLQCFLKKMSYSPKIKIKTLGLSALKKPLYVIQIGDNAKSTDQVTKQALVFFARQHSGEIQSSFLVQSLVSDLLKPSTINSKQVQFLLERFDIYIFPMINVDGVVLGNYRTNAYGYDLNRYWDSQNSVKLPQICLIKSQIKKIAKKQKINMILDLHGHSRKMNSFFYGNNFGKNFMLFPYVASTMSDLIDFKSCTFTKQKSESSKCRTARAILGNMLKQTTNFYTFQMSFFGYKKSNKKIPFLLEDFKRLGRTLLSAIYKIEIQKFKQQKTQKQSLYFKQIQKQINKQLSLFSQQKQSQSDSQAEQITMKEDQVKFQIQQNIQMNATTKVLSNRNENSYIQMQEIGVQTNLKLTSLDQVLIKAMQNSYMGKTKLISEQSQETFQQFSLCNKISSNKHYQESLQTFNNNIIPKLKYLRDREKQTSANFYNIHQGKIQQKKKIMKQFGRKQYLLQKLRIFGQNFTQQSEQVMIQRNNKNKNPSKQTQTNFDYENQHFFQITKNKQKQQKQKQKQKSPYKKDFRNKRKNFSLVLKGERNLKKLEQDISMSSTLKLRSKRLKSNITSPLSQSPTRFDRNDNKNSISLGMILSTQKIQGLKSGTSSNNFPKL